MALEALGGQKVVAFTLSLNQVVRYMTTKFQEQRLRSHMVEKVQRTKKGHDGSHHRADMEKQHRTDGRGRHHRDMRLSPENNVPFSVIPLRFIPAFVDNSRNETKRNDGILLFNFQRKPYGTA